MVIIQFKNMINDFHKRIIIISKSNDIINDITNNIPNSVMAPINLLKNPSTVTKKMLLPLIDAEYLVFDNVNEINDKYIMRIKSLIYDGFFCKGYQLEPKKIIIITDTPSIFESVPTIKLRSTFI